MAVQTLKAPGGEGKVRLTAQKLLAIGRRQQRLILHTFLGIFSLGILIAFLQPKKYESEMKLQVRHEGAEPVISLERDAAEQLPSEASEEELQSAAELIKSRDLLTKVVIACNLQQFEKDSLWDTAWNRLTGNEKSDEVQDNPHVSQAALALEKDLKVDPVKSTNLVSITYTAADPQVGARVLNSLAGLYLERRMVMHRVPDEWEFFRQQAEVYRMALASSEARLANFYRKEGAVSPELEKELTVRKLAESKAAAKETERDSAEARERMRTLESQLNSLSPRLTTQVHTSDNAGLIEHLRSTLSDLELKRTSLLMNFAPDYRPVQEVEEQIAQIREAIETAKRAPLRDEMNDRDPVYETLRGELAKSKTELAALDARALATSRLVTSYQEESEQLAQEEARQQELLRVAKANEENYLLYLRKQEEARVSHELEHQRVTSLVAAEVSTVPLNLQGRRLLIIAMGGLFGALVSAMLALAVDCWAPFFRTAEELQSFFGRPVLAAFRKDDQ